MSSVLSLITVAILWGATNPFIRKGSVGIEKIKCDSKVQQTLKEFIFLLTRWQVKIISKQMFISHSLLSCLSYSI